jgi:hypothetical protein
MKALKAAYRAFLTLSMLAALGIGANTTPKADAGIESLVKKSLLFHRSTSVLNTHVETKNGVVTLSGSAKSMAEKVVSGVKGVKSVSNRISVDEIVSAVGKSGEESCPKASIPAEFAQLKFL